MIEQVRADGFDEGAHVWRLVAGEIVYDHDVAGQQRRREKLLDIGFEGRRVDRAVENQRGEDPVEPKAGDAKVVVFQWPCGTAPRNRSPRGARP